jgi:hypothetical protein
VSTETTAILRAICHQIDDAITRAKLTIEPKVISDEEVSDWRGNQYPNRRVFEGPHEMDDKRKVHKYWPQLVPLAELHGRVQQYMVDVEGQKR